MLLQQIAVGFIPALNFACQSSLTKDMALLIATPHTLYLQKHSPAYFCKMLDIRKKVVQHCHLGPLFKKFKSVIHECS